MCSLRFFQLVSPQYTLQKYSIWSARKGHDIEFSLAQILAESTDVLHRISYAHNTEIKAFIHMQSIDTDPMTPQQAGDQIRGLDVRLTTFNLLAPCYKRMHAAIVPPEAEMVGTGLLAAEAKSRRISRESEFTELWRERAIETVSREGY